MLPFTNACERCARYSIGRLPYLHFLLLELERIKLGTDWKTAVFIFPFTSGFLSEQESRLEYCRVYTSFYFMLSLISHPLDWKIAVFYTFFYSDYGHAFDRYDWKTAVLLLPSTRWLLALSLERIGRLPYYYFLLLPNGRFFQHQKLEDCRIYTSFYSAPAQLGFWIGRLPYLYFLLLLEFRRFRMKDWKTAVFILPFTR